MGRLFVGPSGLCVVSAAQTPTIVLDAHNHSYGVLLRGTFGVILLQAQPMIQPAAQGTIMYNQASTKDCFVWSTSCGDLGGYVTQHDRSDKIGSALRDFTRTSGVQL